MKAFDKMPRKKKGGQSPARVPSGLFEGGTNTGYRLPSMAINNLIPGSPLSSSAKEDIVRNMQEMFSHLDPEVIYIVLSECDFKVENAMDSLLELSVTAGDPQPISTPESGFVRTAAALLSPLHNAELSLQTDSSTQLQCSSTSPTSFMTEEMDFLLDQEVLSLGAEENMDGKQLDNKTVTLPECFQTNVEPQCSGTSIEKSPSLQSLQRSGASSPLDQLSAFEDSELQLSAMDGLPSEIAVDKSMQSTDVFTSNNSSAHNIKLTQQSDLNPGDAFLKSSISNKNMDNSVPVTWNIKAPAFFPHIQDKPGPAFITPVASNWPREPRPTIPWHRPVSQAQLGPSPAMSMSWALPPPQPLGNCRLRLEGNVLVLLRGPPGSGKSTLARALLDYNPGGVILSTDDYFTVNGKYHFDLAMLGEAHSWNHNRAKLAFEQGSNPIIIDNTNMQGWEMKPYVVQALKHRYKVLFREPDTWWKNKPRELERRTKHGVPSERIRRMLCGYERFVTVKSILGSQMPEKKQLVAEAGEKLVNCLKPEMPCPNIVGVPDGRKSQPHTETAPCPPEVSNIIDSDNITDNLDNIDMDLGALDSELDKIGESNEMISDSIVERGNDSGLAEIPVAFSESIGQRTKRERAVNKTGSNIADKSENANKCEKKLVSLQREMPLAKEANSVDVKRFEFEGDWPSAASLDQRQGRSRERLNDNCSGPEKVKEDIKGAVDECTKTDDVSRPVITEFQKLLDLIQTGADHICPDFSPSSSTSPSSEDVIDINPDEPQRSQNKQLFEKEPITIEFPDSDNSEAVEMTLVREHEPDIDHGSRENVMSCSQVSESTECASFGETESSQSGDVPGSQEHKQLPTHRSGKPCKLAMTFTQNCLKASMDSVQSAATAQMKVWRSLELKTASDPCIKAIMNEETESLPSSFTQTESQDFALLWRINENSFKVSDNSSSDVSILCSDPKRFVPCTVVALNTNNCKEIPYTVVHEKSTQVEEGELGSSQDVLENLHILRRHFKQVTLDTLEDLYDKCNRDLEWTTNLLLDSGERFFRDDETEEDRSCTGADNEQATGDGPSSDLINTPKCEELADLRPDVHVEEIEYSDCTISEPCTNTGTNNSDYTAAASILDGVSLPQERNNATLQQFKGNSTFENTQFGATPTCEGEKLEAGAERAEGLRVQTEDDIRSISEVHRLLQAELEELEREEKDREEEKARKKNAKQKKKELFDIKSVELKLPTELALQLTELFGPVGVDPDTGTPEDYVLQMDLNLAKLLHQKWKESVQERQKQAALSFRLLQESSSYWDKPQPWSGLGYTPGHFETNSGGTSHLYGHPDSESHLLIMDHWNVSQPHVSLRDIIKEELALQKNREKVQQSRADLDKRDGATLLKEDQLFALFPTIDRHFLQDIFRDHNYSLTQTQLFLHSLLDDGPVKTVVAPEAPRVVHPRAASKDREKKSVEPVMPSYQDTEDPEYQDFRAEANLQRKRQLENFAKAAEAYKQGHKEVASFYAQQGHLHGQRMREANHRAAVQIFERVNSSLLPRNILDLHGLHVEEALEHLGQVLEDKTTECERGHCRPQLSVITGRGNHSQGGVARIRPAVLDYLTNKHYRFTEPKPGLVLVSLK